MRSTPAPRVAAAAALLVVAALALPAPTRAAQEPTTAAALAIAQPGAALDAMVAFDAAYIPALAATSSAVQDARSANAARAMTQALASAWPALRERLASAWGERPAAGWSPALDRVAAHLAAAVQAMQREDWPAAHEELEEVRIVLMQGRRAQGMDYFVDRLTEFHGAMEAVAQAGAKPATVAFTAAQRAELERAFGEADARWNAVERYALAAEPYGLTAARHAQVTQGIAQERAALDAVRAALQSPDDAALRKAAAGVKPPFARVFTAFGRAPEPRQP